MFNIGLPLEKIINIKELSPIYYEVEDLPITASLKEHTLNVKAAAHNTRIENAFDANQAGIIACILMTELPFVAQQGIPSLLFSKEARDEESERYRQYKDDMIKTIHLTVNRILHHYHHYEEESWRYNLIPKRKQERE